MNQTYYITLEKKLREFPPKRKSERTHAALKVATAKLLEQVGYKNLRVADIAKMAGVGTATFHDYFDNRTHISKEVMTEFIHTISSMSVEQHGYSTAFAKIYFTNKGLMDLYQKNVGIMKSLIQLGDQDEEFAIIWRRMSTGWYEIVTRAIIKKYLVDADKKFLFMTIYTVGGMVDEFMRGLYVYKDAPILDILEQHNIGDEALAYFLSIMWYRGIFGKDPDTIPNEIDPKIVTLFREKLCMPSPNENSFL